MSGRRALTARISRCSWIRAWCTGPSATNQPAINERAMSANMTTARAGKRQAIVEARRRCKERRLSRRLCGFRSTDNELPPLLAILFRKSPGGCQGIKSILF